MQINIHFLRTLIRSNKGELKEGETGIGSFVIKLAIALIAVIIVATIVPDVLGVNVAELCVEEDTILGGITGNHCGDDSVFLTDTVRTIIGDGYSFLLVLVAVAFIGFGAYKVISYRIILLPFAISEERLTTIEKKAENA